MAVYPIKMLKDEGNNPFVPLVGTNAIVDAQGQSLDDKFATKLEAVNIIAGENITLQKVGNNITINGGAGSSVSLIDNLTTGTPGLGALDARQGKALKDLIPAVINNLNSTSTTSALSAYQGYLLKNRVVPAGGTTGQVLKKSSNADNAVEWGDNITVENNLTSTSTTNALSAAQGKVLNDAISGIISTGSNSDGSWIKFADGTMICYHTKNINVACTSQWGQLYEGGAAIGNLPSTFTSTPIVMVTNTAPDGYFEGIKDTTTSTWGTLRMAIPTSSTRTFKVNLLAIGRWK